MRASCVARFRLALERREAKCGGLQCGDGGADARIGGPGGAALLPQQQRLRIAVQGAAREFAGRLQALKCAGLSARHATTNSVSRLRSHPQVKTIAGFAHFACVQAAQHRAVRQRLPIRFGRRERQNSRALE